MMKLIAHELGTRLQDIAWLDKIGGAVHTIERVDSLDQNKIYRFPATDDAWLRDLCSDAAPDSDCTPYALEVTGMEPDTTMRGICYFEDGGSSVKDISHNFYEVEGSLKLVCWMNTPLSTDPPHMQPTKALSEILAKICYVRNYNLSPIIGLSVKATRIHPHSADLFSRYSYDEAVHQHLMPPFQAFGLDLAITYRMPKECAVLTFPEP
jgi:hypothetical protein